MLLPLGWSPSGSWTSRYLVRVVSGLQFLGNPWRPSWAPSSVYVCGGVWRQHWAMLHLGCGLNGTLLGPPTESKGSRWGLFEEAVECHRQSRI